MPGYDLKKIEQPAPIEEEFSHLLIWHGDIRRRCLRGQHFEPVQMAEIEVYERFLAKLQIEMTPFDWDMIFRLDDIWQDCVPKEN